MKDFGWDIKYGFWLFIALIVTAPVFLFFPLIYFFVVSTIVLFTGIKRVLNYRSLKSWDKVQGKLMKTDIGCYRVSIGQYSKPELRYFPLAFFSYEYKTHSGKSDQYAIDRQSVWSTDLESIKHRVAELNTQDVIDVYVHPQFPHKAVLTLEVSALRKSHAWALLISGVLLQCIVIMLWVFSWN